MAEDHKDLGIRATANVELRIPKIPGVDPQVLLVMAQEIIGELSYWAPLTEPQKLADVAGAVLGDVPAMEQIRASLAKAQPGQRVQLHILRPSVIALDPSQMQEVELVLESPCKAEECFGSMDDIASFVTIVGLITSPSARALLALAGKRMQVIPPFTPVQT